MHRFLRGARRALLSAVVLTVLTACGGGGGSDSPANPSANNKPPQISILGSGDVRAMATGAAGLGATVGGIVRLDAGASSDPDSDALGFEWRLVARPSGSALVLGDTKGKVLQFSPDVLGDYSVELKVTDGRGGQVTQLVPVSVDNHAPVGNVVVQVTPVVEGQAYNIANATVGYVYQLDSGASTDADNDLASRKWEILSKPAGSAVTLASPTATAISLSPDVMGDYSLRLTVTDARGASSTSAILVQANNRRPVAAITNNATPEALPSAPSISVPQHTQLTLRGGDSQDADGDALTYLWTLVGKPAGSAAALSSTSAINPTVTVDAEGPYQFRLRVTDTAGAFSERTLTVNVGVEPPVALVDRARITLLAGQTAQSSASPSFDRDGDALSFSWSLDARPAGSAATIATPNQAALSFVPDVAGTYVATVTVSDGRFTASTGVEIRALASIATSVSLGFTPLDARYSSGLDKVVMTTAAPGLRIVDPATGTVESVVLPLAVKNFSLSPQGRLAAVLHEGLVTLVDVQNATVLRTSPTLGSQTEAMVDDASFVMLMGQTGGQWVTPAVTVMNGRTGQFVTQSQQVNGGTFYGTQYGIFSGKLNKAFVMAQGLSPADISFFTIDPATHQFSGSGDSPYHGTYAMQAPLFLTDAEDVLFTVFGTFFSTQDLTYRGKLVGLTREVRSLSNKASAEETLVVEGPGQYFPYSSQTLLPSYKRYTSSLMLPQADLSLPTIGGQQSYGLQVFHSSTGRHVLLVQTGSATRQDPAAQYHVFTR
ncbi:PKD domain-containing protein [Mitsuaria sp. 7]|uniref:PKD domain-containing protein n=1 Tax=Mitsuaria sp. 7 TaxID=1658665 RepID=UPI0007DD806B|nr:PKD domain-containing protein [Mitsuaria sp. 7]ANH68782.1 hypothetical protein ABE85_16540 [Mitsuaria sp. 7]